MLILRSATPADSAAIRGILEAAEPYDRLARVDSHGVGLWRDPETWSDVVVAEMDHAVVGYGALLWPTGPAARAAEVVVHPAWRRRNIGRQLALRLQGMPGSPAPALQGIYSSHVPAAAAFVAAMGCETLGRWRFMLADPPPSLGAVALPEGYRLRHPVIGRDESAFVDIFSAAFKGHRFMEPPTLHQIRQRWRSPEFDPRSCILADCAGQIIGMSSVRPTSVYRGDRLVKAGYIWVIGTHADHRNRGIARAMLGESVNFMRDQGWEIASLDVDELNRPAQRLYRALGFAPVYDRVWWRLPASAAC